MRRQTMVALALLPVLAFGAQACGGDGKDGASAAARTASDQNKMHKFAQCMRENGVDMADPGDDGRIEIKASAGGKNGGPSKVNLEAAQKKCAHLMPNGGKPPQAKPEDIARQRRYSACMRGHGVPTFPDPEPDGGLTIKAEKGGALDPASRAFKEAERACRSLQPKGPGGAGGADGGGR